MTEIVNIESYTAGMRKSMMDKLWFMDQVHSDVQRIVDYGCGDGTLLKMVQEIDPGVICCGYDFNPEMLELARKTTSAIFSDNRESFIQDTSHTLLNASSVFHEIHAYSDDIEEEYAYIFTSGFKYIAIRDMFYSEKAVRKSDPVSLARVYQHYPIEKLREFEQHIGPLEENHNLLQFFLTYRYKENWDREVRENYFPYSVEQFLSKMPNDYEVVHFAHYTLPFLRTVVLEDFGVQLQDATHAKILLRRK